MSRLHRSSAIAMVLVVLGCADSSLGAEKPYHGKPPLLEERMDFSPGTAFEAEALPGCSELAKRDGGVVLDAEYRTLKVLLPAPLNQGVTYALMCRCKAIEDGTFNWIEVKVGEKTLGRVLPCTATFTNKKVLLPSDGAAALAVALTLKEGTGCVIDSIRVYEASEAYYIKKLHGADSRPAAKPQAFTPTDAFRDRAVESALWLEGRGRMKSLRYVTKRMASWGIDPETFKMMIGRYIEYLETPEIPRQDVSNTAFEMYRPMQRWDQIEPNPAFTDAWRLEIVNTFYLMARTSFIDWSAYSLHRYYRPYQKRYEAEWRRLGIAVPAYTSHRERMVPAKIDAATEFGKRHPLLPHNHMTHPSRSLLFAARYFRRYHIPEAPIWDRCAQFVFEPLMHSSKPVEDCITYQYWAMIIIADYAVAEGRKEFFAKDGPLWRFMDLVIMSVSNIGDGAGYGDVGYGQQKRIIPGPVKTNVFDAIVNWKTTPSWMTDEFRGMLQKKRREDYLGIRVQPLEPLYYDHYLDKLGGMPVPEKERFDKISFRRSFDPNDQYLLLDGVSFGYHGHQDGNSILQFDDENRTWLVERGYPLNEPRGHLKGRAERIGQQKAEVLPRYSPYAVSSSGTGSAEQHNAVTVSRPGVNDGEESPLHKTPTFSGLLSLRAGEEFASTSTISRDLNGMDWTRHIVWAKERYFVVFDSLVAREAGPVTLTCRWRTLGEPRLDGPRFQVTQKPKPDAKVEDKRELSFVLVHCDDAALSLSKGLEPPKLWKGYPYAGPEVQVLQERFDGNMNQGDSFVFVNVFAVVPAGEEGKLRAERVNERGIEVTYDGRRRVVELDKRGFPDVR